jgi:hypothetical protein
MDAALAGTLVAVVRTGKLTVPDGGRGVTIDVTDDLLADLLVQVYQGDGGPHRVAEAVTALRRLPGGHDRRLLRVLQDRPELRGLRASVRYELTGRSA